MKVFIPDSHINSKYAPKYTEYISWLPDAKITQNPRQADLFLFAGGEDVSPVLYGEKRNPVTQTRPTRDLEEIYFFNKAIKEDIPMLGVCRGSQFLTVMSGGKLFQDINYHIGSHTAFLIDGRVITVTSTHHQMMNPYCLPEKEYMLLGYAHEMKDFLYYEDGTGEFVELPEGFQEPEIVYYPKTNALAIQGHPERYHSGRDKPYEEAHVEIFELFMNNQLETFGEEDEGE